MARIDYTAILRATKDIIAADANVQNLRATVEIARAVLSLEMSPHINIFEGKRDNAEQTITAGRQHRYNFQWQVMVSAFSAAGVEDAMMQRDEVLGYVELALMNDRSLGGVLTVKQLKLLGGQFRSQPGDNGFWSQAALDLSADITATI